MKVVKFMKFRSLNYVLFAAFCEGYAGRPQVDFLAFGGEIFIKGLGS
jgi:hypothetical protein